MKEHVYLDYNATCPLRPGVREAILEVLDLPGNASSIHMHGREARKKVEHARKQIAELIGANQEKITFNSGATEGNNTIMHAYAPQGVLVSAIEHPCIINLEHSMALVDVTEDGVIDLDHFEEMISKSPPPLLASVMMVNNETGVIQPLKEIVEISHNRGIKVHTDATQAVGRMNIDLFLLNADYMTLSSHKIGGPQGIGALITTNDIEPPVLFHGGGQEKSRRAGTENIPGIVGFGAAAEHARKNLEKYATLKNEQAYLESELKKLNEDIIIYGENVDRVHNTTCFSIPGANAETMLIAFDLDGISLSSGSACSSGKVSHSHVLKAMGAGDEELKGALRLSYGWATTREHIDQFLNAAEKIIKRVRN